MLWNPVRLASEQSRWQEYVAKLEASASGELDEATAAARARAYSYAAMLLRKKGVSREDRLRIHGVLLNPDDVALTVIAVRTDEPWYVQDAPLLMQIVIDQVSGPGQEGFPDDPTKTLWLMAGIRLLNSMPRCDITATEAFLYLRMPLWDAYLVALSDYASPPLRSSHGDVETGYKTSDSSPVGSACTA